MGSGNASQKSDEDDFVKVDDLPLQLTVMCEVRKGLTVKKQNKNAQLKCKLQAF